MDEWEKLYNGSPIEAVDLMKITATIEASDMELLLEKVESNAVEIAFDVCCGEVCERVDAKLLCRKCGNRRDIITDSINYNDRNHSVSNNPFMPFRVVGKAAYPQQRSLMRTCSDHAVFSDNDNKKMIYNYVYQHEGSIRFSKKVINRAMELFNKIRENKYVFRGNGKKGIIGMCIFYAGYMCGSTRTPRQIAELLHINESFLSDADRKLQAMNEKEIIEIPTVLNPSADFIRDYFEFLGIPTKYMQFVIDLIDRAEKKNLHIVYDSRNTTKCAGAVYMLTSRIPNLRHIDKTAIYDCTKISKSTFTKYYTLLYENHRLIKKVFKYHRIPMPNAWRDE